MVYVHIGSVLILPESMSQSLYCPRHIRRQYRNVLLTQGESAHYQCEHTYLLVSSHFYIHSVYVLSVNG